MRDLKTAKPKRHLRPLPTIILLFIVLACLFRATNALKAFVLTGKQHYAKILFQSKTGLWFSLAFPSIGFLIIVLDAFIHADAEEGSTIATFVEGGVVDAVVAPIFLKSKRVQEFMADFFAKLRRDRMLCRGAEGLRELRNERGERWPSGAIVPPLRSGGCPDTVAESIMTTCLRPTTQPADGVLPPLNRSVGKKSRYSLNLHRGDF